MSNKENPFNNINPEDAETASMQKVREAFYTLNRTNQERIIDFDPHTSNEAMPLVIGSNPYLHNQEPQLAKILQDELLAKAGLDGLAKLNPEHTHVTITDANDNKLAIGKLNAADKKDTPAIVELRRDKDSGELKPSKAALISYTTRDEMIATNKKLKHDTSTTQMRAPDSFSEEDRADFEQASQELSELPTAKVSLDPKVKKKIQKARKQVAKHIWRDTLETEAGQEALVEYATSIDDTADEVRKAHDGNPGAETEFLAAEHDKRRKELDAKLRKRQYLITKIGTLANGALLSAATAAGGIVAGMATNNSPEVGGAAGAGLGLAVAAHEYWRQCKEDDKFIIPYTNNNHISENDDLYVEPLAQEIQGDVDTTAINNQSMQYRKSVK